MRGLGEERIERATRLQMRSGGVNVSECRCMAAHYSNGDDSNSSAEECKACPKNAYCVGDRFQPVAKVGYGKLSESSSHFYPCRGTERCPGPGCDCTGGYVASNTSRGVNGMVLASCNVGYLDGSPLCSLCDVEAGYALNLGECQYCYWPESVYFCQPGIHRDPHDSTVDTIYMTDFVCTNTSLEAIRLQSPAE